MRSSRLITELIRAAVFILIFAYWQRAGLWLLASTGLVPFGPDPNGQFALPPGLFASFWLISLTFPIFGYIVTRISAPRPGMLILEILAAAIIAQWITLLPGIVLGPMYLVPSATAALTSQNTLLTLVGALAAIFVSRSSKQ